MRFLAMGAAAMLALGGLAGPALAADGQTVVTNVKPYYEAPNGKLCMVDFAVFAPRGDGKGEVAMGSFGVLRLANGPAIMFKVAGVPPEGGKVRPDAFSVVTATGDNSADQTKVADADDEGFRLFMFAASPGTVQAMSSGRFRIRFTPHGGAPLTAVMDLTITDATKDPTVTDATGPGRFGDCLKKLGL